MKSTLNKYLWSGILNINYHNKVNKTEVKSSYHSAPLKIQNSFYPEKNDVCHTVIIHTAGGIVGGDLLLQNIQLEDNCHSLITTPTATKIYKTNGYLAQQNIKIKLENNSILEYLPQENIIFNGAIYKQNYYIELGDNCHYCTWEINRFGRTAREEKFIQGDWKSSCEISQNGQLLWIERQWLPGNEIICHSLNGLNNDAICGTFYWVGEEVPLKLITQSRQLATKHLKQGRGGVTQLIKGILCRYRGNSTTEVKRWFIDVWGLLRIYFLKKDKIISRVWQI